MKEKKIRHFSEAFKREKVRQLEEKLITVIQLSRLYNVSRAGIYYWVSRYGIMKENKERIVIEKESEGHKTMQLLKQVESLERLLGQKEVEISYLDKVIELGSDLLGEDLKKKCDSQS